MKKARKVEIPAGRPLTVKEYNDLSNHAFNSSLWQATNYSRSFKELRKKLYDKGYPEDDVEVESQDGEIEYFNLVNDALFKLKDYRVADDHQLAESIINSHLSRGNGLNKARTAAFQKGISFEVIDEVVESLDLDDSINAALSKAARQILRSSTFLRTEDIRKRDQKFVQKLVSKGFSFSDISDWKQEYAHLFEDD